MKSSYLFPKLLSNPRMNSGGNSSINSYSNEHYAPKDDERAPTDSNHDDSNNNDPAKRISEPSSGSTATTKATLSSNDMNNKKSVRFQDDASITIHHLSNVPRTSDMSTREKSKLWYDPNEYDQFKYDAAKHAGVKIVRYDHEKVGQSHHFVMLGNFDDKDESCGEEVKIKHPDTSNKGYYNENEYNDHKHLRRSSSISSGGNMKPPSHAAGDEDEMVCKRGLGYHFSRTRKKSRVVTRSAVVAWQRTLRDNTQSSSSEPNNNINVKASKLTIKVKSSNGTTRTTNLDKVDDKFSMMLALISTKCSRVAREEARWRGDVDYRVAYPERHRDDVAAVPNEAKSSAVAIDLTRSDDSNVSNKRSRDASFDSADAADDSSDTAGLYKRQRRSGCGDREDPLSPTTIGYLVSGVLQAEV